jgi:outer membrane protein TolC
LLVFGATVAAFTCPAFERSAEAHVEAQATPRVLTLDDALTMARRRNRALVVEQARLAQAQTSVDQAWAALFPTVVAQGKYTRNNTQFEFPQPKTIPDPMDPMKTITVPGPSLLIQPRNQLDGIASFTAPLIAPPAWAALDAVKTSAQSAEANFDVSETSVLFGVAQAFYAAGIADEVLATRRSGIDVASATLAGAQARLTAGTVTKVDVHRAELALVRAQQANREAGYGKEQAYRALATLIQADGPFKVQSSPPTQPPAAAGADELTTALKLRPEFRALTLTAESAEAQQRAYGWRWSPTLSGFGNARVFNYDNFARQRHSWAAGVQLDWVIFEGGNRDAQRHLAAAQATEARARADVLRDTVRDDLSNGRSLLATKRDAVDAAERSVQLSRETLELVRAQYQAGNITQVDLLSAQDALVLAELTLAQAHFDVATADLTLRRAAGTFPGK